MEERCPSFEAIPPADRDSAARLPERDAIAQAYTHDLRLANRRSKATQIRGAFATSRTDLGAIPEGIGFRKLPWSGKH